MPKKTAVKKAIKKTAKAPVKKTVKKAVKKSARKHVCRITKNDPVRENRIEIEIVVDAYGPEEQMSGWYYSIGDKTVVATANNVKTTAIDLTVKRDMNPEGE